MPCDIIDMRGTSWYFIFLTESSSYLVKKATKWLVLSSQSYLSEGEKKDSFASSLFLYEKENIKIVLAGVQLKKKCIDFRAMSDKILTRKSKRTDFQEGK